MKMFGKAALLVSVFSASCSFDFGSLQEGNPGSGGSGGGSGLGGTMDSGGTTSAGGSYSTGGTSSKGGSNNSGGSYSTGGTSSKGGSNNSGGSYSTGGTISKGGSQSSGVITPSPSGGVTVVNSGGATVVNSGGATVVASGGATVVNSGGATVVASGGVTSTGGVTTAGGSTSGPATCTTDLMTLRTGPPGFNWIQGTPPSCSVQGPIYAYSDGSTCISPSPISATPCTAAGCCISGATVIDATSTKWGCGLGLDLNSSGGAIATKSPYAGPAKGFKVTITGTVAAGQKIRITYASTATPPVGGTAPYKEVMGVGTYPVLFSDATCPTWATGGKCTPVSGSGAYSLQLQIAGGATATDAVGPFSNVCITSIVPL